MIAVIDAAAAMALMPNEPGAAFVAERMTRAEVSRTSRDHEAVVGLDAAGACRFTFDGRSFPIERSDDAAVAQLRSAAGSSRKVQVRADPATGENLPYRCIGGVIYQLQRAGYELKLRFISEPPPSR